MAPQRSERWLVHEHRVGAVLEALGHAGQIVLWPAVSGQPRIQAICVHQVQNVALRQWQPKSDYRSNGKKQLAVAISIATLEGPHEIEAGPLDQCQVARKEVKPCAALPQEVSILNQPCTYINCLQAKHGIQWRRRHWLSDLNLLSGCPGRQPTCATCLKRANSVMRLRLCAL